MPGNEHRDDRKSKRHFIAKIPGEDRSSQGARSQHIAAANCRNVMGA